MFSQARERIMGNSLGKKCPPPEQRRASFQLAHSGQMIPTLRPAAVASHMRRAPGLDRGFAYGHDGCDNVEWVSQGRGQEVCRSRHVASNLNGEKYGG